MYVLRIFLKHPTSAHIIILDLMTQTALGEEYKL